MNIKTDINRKNKHLNNEQISQDSLVGASHRHKGIVRIEGPTTRIEQENHNANHVLNYVALVTLSITHQIRRKATCDTAERIQAHLSCLREFIEEGDRKLNGAVDPMLKSLAVKLPATREDWIAFVANHSQKLSILSQRYGGLKNQELSKMTDLYKNKQWMRIWWWKIVIRNLMRRFHPRRLSAGIVKGAIENFRNLASRKADVNGGGKTLCADAAQTKQFFMSLISNVTCVMEFKIMRRESYLQGKSVYADSAKNQILYFLNFVKHHYPTTQNTGEPLWTACDYLTGYFNEFPKVSENRSARALQEMDQLCNAMGISYRHKFSSQAA